MTIDPRAKTEGVVVTGIGRLVTNDPSQGGLVGVIRDAAVAFLDGRVAWVGPERGLPREWRFAEEHHVGGAAALPGFVDAHTHLVFGGHRADEFGLHSTGASYAEILASGGGIHATVDATRKASTEELADGARRRAERMLAHGTTTVEVKSGYGLTTDDERRCLEVVAALDDELPVDLVPTFLGAHVVPPDAGGDAYVEQVVSDQLPACAPLARFCDVFCDEGVFDLDQARRVLQAGTELGLVPKLHAEQLAATGAARLAAELGAASADHLDHVDADGIRALAEAGVVAVLLPGVTFSLREPPPPARELWDAGVRVAVATDCNPGTSYVETMPLAIALAVRELGLTADEATWAATRGGALALRESHKGHLVPGSAADLVVLDADSHLHLPYRPDGDLVAAVFKNGHRVV